MEVIVNPKTLEGGIDVYQLETAVGAGMKCFENAIGIKVIGCMVWKGVLVNVPSCLAGPQGSLPTSEEVF